TQFRPQERQDLHELREHERLVSLGHDLLELRNEDVDLRSGLRVNRRTEEARIARGLAKAEERFEHVNLCARNADLIDARTNGLPHFDAQRVVDLSLIRIELAPEGLLEFAWQL